MSDAIRWACPRCHTELGGEGPSLPSAAPPIEFPGRVIHGSSAIGAYAASCPECGLPFTSTGDRRFEYPYRSLLAGLAPKRFLTWSDAQNNGYIAYSLMKESSCSVDGRPDVERFQTFMGEHLPNAPRVVLDLGCGPLEKPSYLPAFPEAAFIGIDPFDSDWAGGFVQGAGEFLPLADDSIDLAVAATSLDHTLDLDRTARELARVIRGGGHLMVWDHVFERSSAWRRIAELGYIVVRVPWREKWGRIRENYLPERVRVYDNGIVLWTPKGYADPFHEPRSRRPSWKRRLRSAIEAAGFVQVGEDAAWGMTAYRRG